MFPRTWSQDQLSCAPVQSPSARRSRRSGAPRWSALALGVIGLAACGDQMVPRNNGAFCPPECPAPGASAKVAASPQAATAVPQRPPIDPNFLDPNAVALVLDDARLTAVKAEVDREQYAKAAQALATAMATAGAALSAEDRRAWLYQLGKLRALGGNPALAAKAFEESAALEWALSDHARLQAAQWHVGVGQHDAALANVEKIKGDPALAGAVDLAAADALVGKNDLPGAAARWRAYLARDKHPPQWASITLRLANALLQRPSEAHAEEAIRLARRVEFESSGGAGAAAAKDIEKQALATLPVAKRKPFEGAPADELLRRAKSLVGSHQSKEGLAVANRLAKLPRAAHKGEFACEVRMTRAEALKNLRKKADAADAYAEAVDACAGQAKRPEALYNAGRTSAQAGRTADAMRRYAELEREFPTHRLADDARLKGAFAALDANDEARFSDMLARMPDDYPEGDMMVDGLFALALHKLSKGDAKGALPVLERAFAIAPRERAYHSAGRLPYYLARAQIATGKAAQGEAGLAAIIGAFPLSYYMALAYARLQERDKAAAERALAEAIAREPQGPFLLPRGSWLEAPEFVRALELARQGDAKFARAQLDRVGLSSRSASRELLWASVFLLGKAGASTMAHNILRAANGSASPRSGELTEWLDHYPVGAWRQPWELAFPRPYQAVVATAAKQQNLPEALAHAIMREESAFDPRVVSSAKAFGLMQLIVPTAKRMAQPLGLPWDEEALKRPEVNVPLGCRYLGFLRSQFSDNPLLAIPGYNAGGNAPKRWIAERPHEDFDVWVERIPYEETRQYTKRVMTSLAAYEFLYGRSYRSEALSSPPAASPTARAGGAVTAIADP
jgi:soluble lytic murein transglycosylase